MKLFALVLSLLLSGNAFCQVRIVVPFPPGGGADALARLMAPKLSEIWKEPLIVENKPGASGHIGADFVAQSPGDGKTLLMSSTASLTEQNVQQFAPVTLVSASPYVVTASIKTNFTSIRDLISFARANPGKLTFGHTGIGSQTHLAAENFLWQGKIEVVAVPYKGEGPGLAAAVGGETSFFIGNVAAAIGHIQGGRLRALGVTSKDEAAQLPGVPPIGKTIPGFENTGWFGLVAPTGTPKDIVQKVYVDTKKALEASDLRGRLYVQGLAPVGNTPEQMAREMKEESALWARVVKERHIEVK